MPQFIVLCSIGYLLYRIGLLALVWREDRITRSIGYPVTLAELNLWTTPNAETTQRTATLEDVMRKLDAYQPENRFKSEADRVFRQAYEQVIKDGGELLEISEVAERIAVERNIKLHPDTDILRDKIDLDQIPLASNLAREINELLEPSAGALEELQRVLESGPCQFKIDFLPWPDVNLTVHLSLLRTAQRFLSVHAIWSSNAGDAATAARAVANSFRIAGIIAREPTIMSQLACHSIVNQTVFAAEHFFSRCQPSESDLDAIRVAIDAADFPEAFPRAWAGERCLVGSDWRMEGDRPEWSIARVWGEKPRWLSWRLLYEVPLKFLGYETLTQLHFRFLTRRLLMALDVPPQLRAQSLKRYFDAPVLLPRRGAIRAPCFTMGAQNRAPLTVPTSLNAVRFAIAAEKYRHKHALLPDNADQLIPEFLTAIPLSLNTGRPLRYKRMSTGYAVLGSGSEIKPDFSASLQMLSGMRVLR